MHGGQKKGVYYVNQLSLLLMHALMPNQCTLGLDAPAHSSCQRCLKLKQVCFVELIPVPKKKHNTELCQECRRSKQAVSLLFSMYLHQVTIVIQCIFPYGPYPAKCYNCAIRGLNCSEPKKANAPQPKQHAPPVGSASHLSNNR